MPYEGLNLENEGQGNLQSGLLNFLQQKILFQYYVNYY